MNGERKKRVLFICTHNSARSQMAEGLLRKMYGDKFEVFSAGTEPSGVNPYAIRAMLEIGIDISLHRSKSIDEFKGKNFELVATVCDRAKENCPFFPSGKRVMHQQFEDPSEIKGSDEEIMKGFRRIRDELSSWIKNTFEEIDL